MRPRRCRPRLQTLEGRDIPGHLTVTFAAATHTLTVVGDAAANNVTVEGDAADPTHFTLSSSVDTFNGSTAHTLTQSGVRDIAIRLLGGDDAVGFPGGVPVHLAGSLTVDGGEGANSLAAQNLTVVKGLTVRNGAHVTGITDTTLTDPSVGGGLSVTNGDGDTNTVVQRNAAGLSAVGGSVRVTNGTGRDTVSLGDLVVGGSVTVHNGHANAGGVTGSTQLFNRFSTAARSRVRGSVLVSYLDGTGSVNGLFDTEVGGNVACNYGTGGGSIVFDGFKTAGPVLVHGNVTVKGAGAVSLTVGFVNADAGLVVGKNLTVAGGNADVVLASKLTVGGSTTFAFGDGDNQVTINDSLFDGAFSLTTGAGADTVKLETFVGTTIGTTFVGPVRMSLGSGNDVVNVAAASDAKEEVVYLGTFVIHHGTGIDTLSQGGPGHVLSPLGTPLLFVG
jgi:hypothetical protein